MASPPTAARASSWPPSQAGLGDIPFVGPDGINDGCGGTKDSFLNLAGDDGQELVRDRSPAIGDFPARGQFDADYKAEYGIGPDRLRATGLRLRAGRHRRARTRGGDHSADIDGAP